jgi:hypothetical protein
LENTEENSEKIGKIWKKIVKRYEKDGVLDLKQTFK